MRDGPLAPDDVGLLAAIPAVEAASGTPHAQALATETGLRLDDVEAKLRQLETDGLVTVEGVGAQQGAWASQPAYRLTGTGRDAVERGA